MFWFLLILIGVGWVFKLSSAEKVDSASKTGNLINMVAIIIFVFIAVTSCLDAIVMYPYKKSLTISQFDEY